MDTSGLELRFRIGSIPVIVEPWFWLSGLMFNMQSMEGPRIVLWLLVFFVSVLVHELGHALAIHAFGARASIRLHSFGGLTHPSRNLSRWRSVAMTLAGPGAGFVLGGLALLTLRLVPTLPPLAYWTVERLMIVNFFWGVMNLLPIPPLDGGHVLLGVLGRRYERTARIIAVAFAGLVVLYGLSSGQLFLTIMFGLLAFQNIQTLRAMSSH
jgi:Zn-dependent protease